MLDTGSFPEIFFENVDLEKSQQMTKIGETLLSMKIPCNPLRALWDW